MREKNIIVLMFLIVGILQSNELFDFTIYQNIEITIPDSIKIRIMDYDQERFAFENYGHKDFGTSFRDWWNTHDSINKVLDKTLKYTNCIKYFDSCSCNYLKDSIRVMIRRGIHQYLNNKNYDIFKELSKYKDICLKRDSIAKFKMTADTLDGRYIPFDTEDALKQMKIIISKDRLAEFAKIKEEDVIPSEHFNLGSYLRNYWDLWFSRLTLYYVDKYDLGDADSISGCLLLILHKNLNNKPVDYDKIFNAEVERLKIDSNNQNK